MSKRHRFILLAMVAIAGVIVFDPTAPWWKVPTIRPEDRVPINVSQLTYVATQAKGYLDRKLVSVGGSGPTIGSVINDLNRDKGNISSAVTIARLKEASKPFYDRLIAVGFNSTANMQQRLGTDKAWTSAYPWKKDMPAQEDGKAAEFGQLKFIFGFDLSNFTIADNLSTNTYGIPDKWLVGNNLDPFEPSVGYEDADGDGLFNQQEYEYGTDPFNRDTDGDGVRDGDDALALDANFTFARQAVPHYAIMDLGPGVVVDMNNEGNVLFSNTTAGNTTYRLWKGGRMINLPISDLKGDRYLWSILDNKGNAFGVLAGKDADGGTRPVRWKEGIAAPVVLTPGMALAAIPGLRPGLMQGEIPGSRERIFLTRFGCYYEVLYYYYSGYERYEIARLLLWDGDGNIRFFGDPFGNGPGPPPSSVSRQPIILGKEDKISLLFVMAGPNRKTSSGDWKTDSFNSALYLDGKLIPGSSRIKRFSIYSNFDLGDLGKFAVLANLTHPVVPDFFGNHTLYMDPDPAGRSKLVAVDWHSSPRGNDTVKFSSINSLGTGLTTGGKTWMNGKIYDMKELDSGVQKYNNMTINSLSGSYNVVSSTVSNAKSDNPGEPKSSRSSSSLNSDSLAKRANISKAKPSEVLEDIPYATTPPVYAVNFPSPTLPMVLPPPPKWTLSDFTPYWWHVLLACGVLAFAALFPGIYARKE